MVDIAALAVHVGYDDSEVRSGVTGTVRTVETLGSSLQSALGAAAVGAVVGLGAAFAGSIKTAADFEHEISGISAVSGATASELDGIRQTALQLGKDTSFSASEAAAGMEEMVKAGVSLQDVMGGAGRAALDLAAAGGLSVAESAQIASNAMNDFSLKGTDMAHVADVVAGAANASAIDVHDFGFSLSAVGAVAATVGLGLDDTATAIAVLGQAGLKGSDAGTSLKTMLLNLNPASKSAQKELQALGIITADGSNKFFDAAGNVKSMSEVAQILQSSMQGLTKEQQINALQTAFGTDAIRAAAIMAKAGAAGFDDMAAAMSKVSAQDVANERLNNLEGSIEKLSGSLETGAIIIGSLFTPALKDMADMLTDQVNAGLEILNQLPDVIETVKEVFASDWAPADSIQPFTLAVGNAAVTVRDTFGPAITAVSGFVADTLLPAIAAVTAPLAAFGVGFLSTVAAAGLATAAVTAVVAVLGFLVTPLGLVAVAVGALAAAWTTDFGGIQEVAASVVDWFKENWPLISETVATVNRAAEGENRSLADSFRETLAGINRDAGVQMANLVDTIKLALHVINGDWRAAWTDITAINDREQKARLAAATAEGVAWQGIIDTWTGGALTSFDTWTKAIATTLSDAWASIKADAEAAWGAASGIAKTIADAWATIQTGTDTAGLALKNVLIGLWGLLYSDVIAPKLDAITGAVGAAWDLVSTQTHAVFDPVLAYIRDTIFEPIRAAVETKVNAARDLFGLAVQAVSDKGHEILDPLLTWWQSTIWEPIRSVVETVSTGEKGVQTTFTGAVTAISTTITTTMDAAKSAWVTIWGAIETAARSPEDALNEIISLVGKLKDIMPDWLIPHSPTPFQIGLEGIMKAAKGMDATFGHLGETLQGGAISGTVDDWLKAAMRYTGVPDSWLGGLEWLVGHESGGDPHAKNPDSTASGLFQMIDTAWDGARDTSLPDDIFNPIINAIAGIRYISDRYGNPDNAVDFWKEHGHYAEGGWAGLDGPELAWLGEKGPEYVVPNAALHGGGAAGPVETHRFVIQDPSGRTIEDWYVTGREMAIRRGRVPAGAA